MTPVVPHEVPCNARRVVFAKDQPQYLPLPAVIDGQGRVTTEWELTAEELDHLFQGGRIRLTISTFHQPLQPVMLMVAPPECGFRGE